VKARSEFHLLASPGSLRLMKPGDGCVVETSDMFHDACAASNQPDLSPMRRSGLGAEADMSGVGMAAPAIVMFALDVAQPTRATPRTTEIGRINTRVTGDSR